MGATREESHALFTPIDEAAEGAVYVEISRGDITVHDERVIHGSGPNMSSSWRKVGLWAVATCWSGRSPLAPLQNPLSAGHLIICYYHRKAQRLVEYSAISFALTAQ